MKNVTPEEEYHVNPVLDQLVEPDTDLKNWLVEYVGSRLSPDNMDVTVEMIVEVVAAEFPEFLLAVAEENYIRGYEQALDDLNEAQKMQNE
jgi:hypothetical protein